MEQQIDSIEFMKKHHKLLKKLIQSDWLKSFKERNILKEKSSVEISVDNYMKDNDKARNKQS